MTEEQDAHVTATAKAEKFQREENYRFETLNLARQQLNVASNMDNTLVAIYEHMTMSEEERETKVKDKVKRTDNKPSQPPKPVEKPKKPAPVTPPPKQHKPLVNLSNTDYDTW